MRPCVNPAPIDRAHIFERFADVMVGAFRDLAEELQDPADAHWHSTRRVVELVNQWTLMDEMTRETAVAVVQRKLDAALAEMREQGGPPVRQ